MRILHFSDIHLEPDLRRFPLKSWLGKRCLAGLNLVFRRRRHFADSARKVATLPAFCDEHDVDLVIFSGDYVAMGTRLELVRARQAVEPLMHRPLGYVNVPGNHDIYLSDTVRGRWWEESFGDTLGSDLEDRSVDGPWPLVRLVGDEVAVVAVNSARPNPSVLKSSGRIPPAQLAALADLLGDPRIRDRFTFVVTHYAPRLPDGSRDTEAHGLDNADELLEVVAGMDRGAVLFGHVHHCCRIVLPGVRPTLFDAGSATYTGREGLWMYEMTGREGRAIRGRWTGERYELDRAEIHPL